MTLSADAECDFSGLPMAFCAHCTGVDDELAYDDEYETIGRSFEAQFKGRCTIEYDHVIKRGDLVSRVRHADNPMLPVSGVACSACVRSLPRGVG